MQTKGIFFHRHRYHVVACCIRDSGASINTDADLRGTTGVPRKGVWASVHMRVWTCEDLRAEHDQTSRYLRPPFLGTPLVPSRDMPAAQCHAVRSRAVPCRAAPRHDTKWHMQLRNPYHTLYHGTRHTFSDVRGGYRTAVEGSAPWSEASDRMNVNDN